MIRIDFILLFTISAEDEAPQWPSDKPFPNFNELVEQIHEVAIHYKCAIVVCLLTLVEFPFTMIPSRLNTAPVCFGIGVGLGAVLLLHYAVRPRVAPDNTVYCSC